MIRFREHHLVLGLLVAASLLRLVPHPGNMAAIGALALFSGAQLQSRWLWIVPLVALLLGDVVNGQRDAVVLSAIAAAFLGVAEIGRRLLGANAGHARIALGVALAAVLVWVSATLGHWLASSSADAAGVAAAFSTAPPLLIGQLAVDALYAALIFSLFGLTRELPFVYFTSVK